MLQQAGLCTAPAMGCRARLAPLRPLSGPAAFGGRVQQSRARSTPPGHRLSSGPRQLLAVVAKSALHLPDRSPTGALTKEQEVQAFMRMARLHNTLPALLLVLVGAWSGVGRSPSVLVNGSVWLMALISAGVAAGSCLINDYFDFASGTDQLNAPHKPLPSGTVKPDVAVLVAGGLYVLVLMAACLMDHPGVRAIVAFSAGATLLYTPIFKRVTLLKNALVASVIALAPLSGALAAGADAAMLQRLAVPSLFSFTAIIFREVLMDCADEQGDRQSGVVTLPVLMGPAAALLLATVLLLGGALAAISGLLTSNIPLAASSTADAAATTAVQVAGAAVAQHALPLSVAWPHLACAGLIGLCVLKLVGQVVHVYASGMSEAAISSAVDDCIKPVGLAIVMLAAMA